MDLPAPGAPDQGHRFSGSQVQVEAIEHRRTARLVGEGHVVEADVAAALDEVDGAGPIDDRGLLVEDLVDPLRRRRSPLPEHDEHPQHLEGGLQHHDPEAEGEDGADLQVVVDDQVAAEQDHQGQSDLGEVLHQRGELGPDVRVLDVGPPQPLRRSGQGVEPRCPRRRRTSRPGRR